VLIVSDSFPGRISPNQGSASVLWREHGFYKRALIGYLASTHFLNGTVHGFDIPRLIRGFRGVRRLNRQGVDGESPLR
jgi:hypothetical protein